TREENRTSEPIGTSKHAALRRKEHRMEPCVRSAERRMHANKQRGLDMKFAAVGFVCVDVYQNLGVRYPTGNGIDLMFNLMDLMPDIEPAVIAAVGDDDH